MTPILNDATNVAHAAHLGGLLFGWLYFIRRMRVESLFERTAALRRRNVSSRPRGNLKLFKPDSENLDNKVDAILEKISEHGEESLDEREREILKRASRVYRNRT